MTQRGHEGTFWNDGNALYFDLGGSYTDRAYTYKYSLNCMLRVAFYCMMLFFNQTKTKISHYSRDKNKNSLCGPWSLTDSDLYLPFHLALHFPKLLLGASYVWHACQTPWPCNRPRHMIFALYGMLFFPVPPSSPVPVSSCTSFG